MTSLRRTGGGGKLVKTEEKEHHCWLRSSASASVSRTLLPLSGPGSTLDVGRCCSSSCRYRGQQQSPYPRHSPWSPRWGWRGAKSQAPGFCGDTDRTRLCQHSDSCFPLDPGILCLNTVTEPRKLKCVVFRPKGAPSVTKGHSHNMAEPCV